MPRKNSNKEQEPPVLSFGSVVGGKDALVGEVVSINLKRGPYFGIGDIRLSPERYWATVSDDMPPEYYTVIRSSLVDGYLVTGKQRTYIIDRPEGILDQWASMVSEEGRSTKSVAAFRELIRKKYDQGYSLEEITQHCLKVERLSKSRESTIKLLEAALMYVETSDADSYYDRKVYEDEEGKIEVPLTKTADGSYTAASSAVSEPKPPEGHIGGSAKASDVLDDVLEL